jgi:hypothetical protein
MKHGWLAWMMMIINGGKCDLNYIEEFKLMILRLYYQKTRFLLVNLRYSAYVTKNLSF